MREDIHRLYLVKHTPKNRGGPCYYLVEVGVWWHSEREVDRYLSGHWKCPVEFTEEWFPRELCPHAFGDTTDFLFKFITGGGGQEALLIKCTILE